MRKKLIAAGLIAGMLSLAVAGCGKNSNYTTKVELRDDPVKSSTDYAGGSGNATDENASKSDGKENSDSLKIGFVQTANESGWRAAHTKSMEETFSDTSKYTYTFVDGQADQAVQIKGIQKFIDEGYDAIIVAPIVVSGWDDILKKAKDAGIPVIIVDRQVDSDESLYSCWVGSDFDTEGKNAAEWLVKELGTSEPKNIVVLEGTPDASATLGRTKGFNDVISQYGNYTILASESADFDKAKGKELMNKYLSQFPSIDVIVTQNDNMAYGVIEALTEKGANIENYTIISFDGEAEAFKLMVDGKIDLDVECNPLQGPTVEKLLQDLLAGKSVDKTQFMEEGVYPASSAKDEVANRKY